jgi:hypothetical protein
VRGKGGALYAYADPHACMHHGKYSRWPVPALHPTCATLAYGGTAGAPPLSSGGRLRDAPLYLASVIVRRARPAAPSSGDRGVQRPRTASGLSNVRSAGPSRVTGTRPRAGVMLPQDVANHGHDRHAGRRSR